MSRPQPTPRQVLYALVAAGFLGVVGILTIGAAVGSLVPTWWSLTLGVSLLAAGAWISANWRRTGLSLGLSIGLFVLWLVGTSILVT